MNTLHLTIGGRSFAIGVQAGDEDHIRHLGSQIDTKFQQLAPRYSQNLLFATLQLADDLHRAQMDWAKVREEAQAAEDANADVQRQAGLALSQTEKLRSRISELEAELDQLQSATQQEGNKYNDLMADNERFKVAVLEADAEIDRLKGELATASRERDHFEDLLRSAPPEVPATPPEANAVVLDPDLAPSLERFAELLENCVAKLERGPAAP